LAAAQVYRKAAMFMTSAKIIFEVSLKWDSFKLGQIFDSKRELLEFIKSKKINTWLIKNFKSGHIFFKIN
jgi:hypothetical protein